MHVNNTVSFQTGLTNEQYERLEVALKGLQDITATITVNLNVKGQYVYTITLDREMTAEAALHIGIIIGSIQVAY